MSLHVAAGLSHLRCSILRAPRDSVVHHEALKAKAEDVIHHPDEDCGLAGDRMPGERYGKGYGQPLRPPTTDAKRVSTKSLIPRK